MGGCATKPKAEGCEAPAPEKVKEVLEAKEVVVAEEVKGFKGETEIEKESTGVDKEKEIVVDDHLVEDEHGNRRRSLSNLFKENEGKDLTEPDKKVVTPSDPEKQQEPSVNQKPTDISESKPNESVEIETPVEQAPKEVLQVPTVEAKAEKAIEVEETIPGTSAEKIIDSAAATEMLIPEEKKMVEETPKLVTPEEKNAIEEKPVTVS